MGSFVGIILVASTLRVLVTPVGPLLGVLEHETGASTAVLGLLTALPVLGFAIVSPLVYGISGRIGVESSVVLGLAVIVGGAVLRSASAFTIMLLLGTALISVGVAIGNVLVPVVTKRYFPGHATGVTGTYMAVQTIAAAAAAGLVIPLYDYTGSWNAALGFWVIPGVLALLFWVFHIARGAGTRREQQRVPRGAVRSPWRTITGWQVAIYFLCQSGVFYLTINWLPTIAGDLGFSATRAGWQVSWLLLISIVANIATPRLMNVGGDQRFIALLLPALVPIPLLGLVVLPQVDLLWISILGLSCGGSMVLSLSLISIRSHDSDGAAELSSMSQTVAYGGVAAILVAASVIRDVSGPGIELLWFMGLLAAFQFIVGWAVGRDGRRATAA